MDEPTQSLISPELATAAVNYLEQLTQRERAMAQLLVTLTAFVATKEAGEQHAQERRALRFKEDREWWAIRRAMPVPKKRAQARTSPKTTRSRTK